MREEKLKYFNTTLFGANCKTFWKMVKFLNKQEESLPALHGDNIKAVKDKEKLNMLNGCVGIVLNHHR